MAQILAQVRRVVANADAFDPKRSRRKFVIGATDGLAVVALPGVLAAVSKSAPGVRVSVRETLPGDVIAALDAREIDVALYPGEDAPARFEARFLYEEDFVIAARADHALGARPSLDKYCSARHLLVSRIGDERGFVDDVLAQHGRARTVALTVPSFMFALAAIAASDLIGTLPRNLLRAHAARFGLVMLEPPLVFLRSRVHAMTPRPAMSDGGVAWLMDVLERLLSQPARPKK